MIQLNNTSTVLRLVTSSAATIDVFGAYMDYTSSTYNFGSQRTAISSATTTTIVNAPAASTTRIVDTILIANRHATLSCTIFVQQFDGTNAFRLFTAVLAPGETAQYTKNNGWQTFNANGAEKTALGNQTAAVVSQWNTVVVTTSVSNSTTTLQDITGLSFAVTSGETYAIRAMIRYDSAAIATGARFVYSAPTGSSAGMFIIPTSTLTAVLAFANANGLPSAASSSSAFSNGNLAFFTGVYECNSNGTFQFQFASGVAASAITIQPGTMLEYMRTI